MNPDVRLEAKGGLLDVPGFKANAVACGIKRKRPDLAIIASDVPGTSCAAVFTTNRVQAAPVTVSKPVAAKGRARAIVANSGCANACTGGQGLLDAEAMQAEAARALGVDASEVVVCSTGVIGRHLPMENVTAGIRACAGNLQAGAPGAVARAVMTTDAVPKEILVTFTANGRRYSLAGVAKGAGMIHPEMATMLAFLVTDAPVAPADLTGAFKDAVDATFNMITVDGDQSTNDAAVVLANGAGGGDALAPGTPAFHAFREALALACRELAIAIVRDGEGATTVMEVRVQGAASREHARVAARAVAASSLVKAAVFGRDPNWGRVLAALGACGVPFDPANVRVALGNASTRAWLVKDGAPCATLDEDALRAVMDAPLVHVLADLGAGDASATAWGCDLTHEYVTINAEYTT